MSDFLKRVLKYLSSPVTPIGEKKERDILVSALKKTNGNLTEAYLIMRHVVQFLESQQHIQRSKKAMRAVLEHYDMSPTQIVRVEKILNRCIDLQFKAGMARVREDKTVLLIADYYTEYAALMRELQLIMYSHLKVPVPAWDEEEASEYVVRMYFPHMFEKNAAFLNAKVKGGNANNNNNTDEDEEERRREREAERERRDSEEFRRRQRASSSDKEGDDVSQRTTRRGNPDNQSPTRRMVQMAQRLVTGYNENEIQATTVEALKLIHGDNVFSRIILEHINRGAWQGGIISLILSFSVGVVSMASLNYNAQQQFQNSIAAADVNNTASVTNFTAGLDHLSQIRKQRLQESNLLENLKSNETVKKILTSFNTTRENAVTTLVGAILEAERVNNDPEFASFPKLDMSAQKKMLNIIQSGNYSKVHLKWITRVRDALGYPLNEIANKLLANQFDIIRRVDEATSNLTQSDAEFKMWCNELEGQLQNATSMSEQYRKIYPNMQIDMPFSVWLSELRDVFREKLPSNIAGSAAFLFMNTRGLHAFEQIEKLHKSVIDSRLQTIGNGTKIDRMRIAMEIAAEYGQVFTADSFLVHGGLALATGVINITPTLLILSSALGVFDAVLQKCLQQYCKALYDDMKQPYQRFTNEELEALGDLNLGERYEEHLMAVTNRALCLWTVRGSKLVIDLCAHQTFFFGSCMIVAGWTWNNLKALTSVAKPIVVSITGIDIISVLTPERLTGVTLAAYGISIAMFGYDVVARNVNDLEDAIVDGYKESRLSTTFKALRQYAVAGLRNAPSVAGVFYASKTLLDVAVTWMSCYCSLSCTYNVLTNTTSLLGEKNEMNVFYWKMKQPKEWETKRPPLLLRLRYK